MGIESSRRWGVCSLNEFRKVCDLLSFHPLRTVLNRILLSSSQFLGLKRKNTLSLRIPTRNLILGLLIAYESFLEWNSDKDIAEAAERLYSNINNLELYVGLQAEEAKKPVEGAGLCPGAFRRPSLCTLLTTGMSAQDTPQVAPF